MAVYLMPRLVMGPKKWVVREPKHAVLWRLPFVVYAVWTVV